MQDALRERYRQAVQRRLQAAPERVQQALRARLPAPADESPSAVRPGPLAPPVAARAGPAPTPASLRAASRRVPPPTPLGQLHQHIADASGHGAALRPELRSAQAFRETWAHICAEDEVVQAVQRGPENPGPLNSHTLVLRSLRLMSELSPDYLRRFMAHADTLLWLEEASPWLKPAQAGKAGKPGRSAKAAKGRPAR